MSVSGAFAAPAWRRLLPALACAAAWLAIELALAMHVPRAAPAAAPVAASAIAIEIESTFAVAAWSVRIDGVQIAGAGDDRRWRGRADDARSLDVRAEPADPLADAPCALRVHVTRAGSGRAHLLWGRGAVAGAIPLAGP
ncbi:MAG TPA: hypothetical protein VEL07_07645 [Planctomycetota bacterium]|nr:hypothetical protein [Planctomycetota bacterium]